MNTSQQDAILETHNAPAQVQSIRLQEYGVGVFKTIHSKSALKKIIKKKLIYVNGNLASTATIITGGEVITLHQSYNAPNQRKFVLPLEVLFEDEYLALINKPAGILVNGNTFKTIGNALAQNLKKSRQEDATHPKPVHRLDFATTGLLLVGKTSATVSALSSLFEDKKITKTYYAITIGVMTTKNNISTPIDGKKALSAYELIKTVASKRFGCLNLVKLFPKTGRRHQLRKHMAAIGNPILGDCDYGIEDMILKGKGLYLHAFSLQFIHPVTKKKVYFEKEQPMKFKKIFA